MTKLCSGGWCQRGKGLQLRRNSLAEGPWTRGRATGWLVGLRLGADSKNILLCFPLNLSVGKLGLEHLVFPSPPSPPPLTAGSEWVPCMTPGPQGFNIEPTRAGGL
jgi:hypothetical protein